MSFLRRAHCVPLLVFGLILHAAGVCRALDPGKELTQFVHKTWTTEHGLAQNSINDIVQTHDGHLWLATFGGLARFNGVEFTIFDSGTEPGLTSNRITSLAEAPDGTLWFGTEEGRIGLMRHGVFSTLQRDSTVRIDGAWDLEIVEDDRGSYEVWIADRLGVVRRHEGKMERLEGIEVGGTLFQSEEGLWIGSLGLFALHRPQQDLIVYDLHSEEELVHSILEDGEGGLWIGTSDRLLHFDGEEITPWLTREGSRRGIPSDMILDRDGTLWISIGRAVYRLRPESLSDPVSAEAGVDRLEIHDGFAKNLVRTIYEDDEGSLWLGAAGGGLHLLRGGEFTSFTSRDEFASGAGKVVTEFRGEVVVGTYCNGVYRFRDDGFMPFAQEIGPKACVAALLGEEDDLWIGADGVWHLDARDAEKPLWRRIGLEDGLPSLFVYSIYRDRSGVLWFGTETGLVRWEDPHPMRVYTEADGLVDSRIFFLTEDRSGTLWIATRNGVSRLRDEVFDNLTTLDGLPEGYVRTIHEDQAGTMWIGTYGGGMMRLANEGAEATRFFTGNGMRENIVSQILEEDGNFWLSGNRGVTRVRRAALDAFARSEIDAYEAVLYSESRGLAPSETNGGSQPAGWKASDGRLWFPTLRGVAVLDPRAVQTIDPPPVVIERILRDGETLVPINSALPRSLSLPSGTESLEITYAGLRLSAPEEVRYHYRLVGFDDTWRDVGNRRTAYFTHLRPGSYRFEVGARAHDGGEPGTPAQIVLVIAPFWWQTNAFRLLALGICLFLIFFSIRKRSERVRQRTKHLEETNQALESEVRRRRHIERERGLVLSALEQKVAELGEFNYTVSHDLKNPLLTIRTFLGKLDHDLGKERSPQIEKDLQRIHEAAEEMSELLDDLVELARIGKGSKLTQSINLEILVREAVLHLGEELAGIDVRIQELPIVIGDRSRLREVFERLLSNAARFMGDQAKPCITISCRQEGTKTIFSVRDNGIGIEPMYHEKVFELFERLDHSRSGTGIGLTIVRRIIDLHGGRVWVKSAGAGQGSAFCFVLPQEEG